MLTPEYLRELAAEGRVHPDSWSNDARVALGIMADYLEANDLADAFDEGVRSWGELMIRRSELNNPYRSNDG